MLKIRLSEEATTNKAKFVLETCFHTKDLCNKLVQNSER